MRKLWHKWFIDKNYASNSTRHNDLTGSGYCEKRSKPTSKNPFIKCVKKTRKDGSFRVSKNLEQLAQKTTQKYRVVRFKRKIN